MKTIEYLIISFASLPLPRPRSYQIAKLLRNIKGRYFLLTSECDTKERLDFSLDSYVAQKDHDILRVKDKSSGVISKILFRFLPILSRLPDNHIFWIPSVINQAKKLKLHIKPRVIIAFSRPETDLLIGVKLKKIFNVPLVIHFSDPWVDNPYYERAKGFIKWSNSLLESWVMKNADLILFTNEDQKHLVMRKYSKVIQNKARTLDHCYDDTLYPLKVKKLEKFIIRHIGNLYKQRTPDSFLQAIQRLIEDNPDIKKKILIEFYGQISESAKESIKTYSLENIVSLKSSVPYKESLELMDSTDLLLNIDAESEHNIFFPSKLVDYIGSKKNVLCISSPKGPSSEIINSYGGKSFSHEQVDEIKDYILNTINSDCEFGCDPKIVEKYSVKTVANYFENIVRPIINN